MTDLVGKRLAGKYEIQAEIGRGGMGVVYRGYDLMLQRVVAVKVLPREFTYGQQFVQRFRQEAIMAAGLHQPNIVTIYDVGEQDGVHFIVMQFLEGVTLDQWLVAHGPMPLPQANHIVRQMADALDYAHSRDIVHRDIKPSNIMVGPNGHITLMDFGLVRAGEGTGLTRTGMIVGTPEYMAPEQALGYPVDGRTDIYSFGVVIYRMLSGQVPFARSTSMAVAYAHVNEPPPLLRELRPDVPKPVEAVVFKALAKRPGERYQQAGQLAAQFAQAVGGKMPSGLRTVATPPPGVAAAVAKTPAPATTSRPAPSSPRPFSRPSGNPPLAAEAPTQLLSQATPAPPVNAAHASPSRRPSRVLLAGAAVLLFMLAAGVVLSLGGSPRTVETADTQATVSDVKSVLPDSIPAPGAEIIGAVTSVITTTAIEGQLVLTSTGALAVVTSTPTVTPLPVTAMPAATTVDTATPTVTPSASPTATSTATRTPTATSEPTPAPTVARGNAMPTPTTRPTSTPAPMPTDTPIPPPAPAAVGIPILVSPGEDASLTGITTFSWQWGGPALAPGQAFEVRLWQEGQSDHYGAAEPVRAISATFDIAGAYGVQQGGSGRYLWTVAVVQISPYQRIGQEAPPRAVTVQVGSASTPTPSCVGALCP